MNDRSFMLSPIFVLTVITVTLSICTIYRTRFSLPRLSVQKMIHNFEGRYDIIKVQNNGR